MSVPMIAGLYPYTRNGVTSPPKNTLREIPISLQINPEYQKILLVLAGDSESSKQLTSFGLQVHRTFDDAPPEVHRDAAHKMKHWMCLWALREFGEFLWIDWDTVLLRYPDQAFWEYCRRWRTPKFVRIPGYWATVNCGVYYACHNWLSAMERSFHTIVSEPNDELLWASILPRDIDERGEFWWGKRVVDIWSEKEFNKIEPGSYLAHVRDLNWAESLRIRQREGRWGDW